MMQGEPRITQGTLQTSAGVPLPLERTEVRVKVGGPVAEVEVRQVFTNDTDTVIEAVYLFPLPHEASVYRMEFTLRARVVRAVVKEKEEARRAYEKARSEGRAATLLEQDRPNLFTLSVANVPPGEKIAVTLGYLEQVAYDDGEWRFVFPMVSSERYHPGAPRALGATTEVPDSARIRPPRPASGLRSPDVSLELELLALREIKPPRSPTHKVDLETVDVAIGHYRAKLSVGEGVANRDFVLAWRDPRPGLRPEGYFQRESGRPGSFLLTLTPPSSDLSGRATAKTVSGPEGEAIRCGNCGGALEDMRAVKHVEGIGSAWQCHYCGVVVATERASEPAPLRPRDVLFLLDRSNSMRGQSLAAARRAVRIILDALAPQDALQLFAFDHERVPFDGRGETWVDLDSDVPRRVDAFLKGIEARGGSELDEALKLVKKFTVRKGRTKLLVLLTDGAFGNEGRLLKSVPEALGSDVRLYVLGVGASVNRYLVEKLARVGGGASDVLLPGEDVETVGARFARRVRAAGPVLSELAVAWDDAMPADIYPFPIPDLFGGQSLSLVGRYSGEGPSRLVLTGKTVAGTVFRQEIDVALPGSAAEVPGLERLWARQRISSRLDRLVAHPNEASDIRVEVLGLALKHSLMSPYTSLVAEDSEKHRPEGAHTREGLAPAEASVEAPSQARLVAPAPQGKSDARERLRVTAAPASSPSSPRQAAPPGGAAGSPSIARARGAVPASVSEADESSFARMKEKLEKLESEAEGSLGGPIVGEAYSAPAPMGYSSHFADAAPFDADGALAEMKKKMGVSPEPSPPRSTSPITRLTPLAKSGGIAGFFKRVLGLGESLPEAPEAKAPAPTPEVLKPQSSERTSRREDNPYAPEELAWARGRSVGELDLVFLVDETGSMGAYINEVKARLMEIVNALKTSPLCHSLRIGLVSYRDHPPQDPTFASRVIPLTDDLDAIERGVRSMKASGGGDGPESVTDGLYDLVRLDWRPRAARVVVWVGDAPPHGVEPTGDEFPLGCPCGHHWYTQAENCREMGVAIHAVGCVPAIRHFVGAEEVFKTVARTTRGLYLPLSRASLLIPLISTVAEEGIDRQRVEEHVIDQIALYEAELQAADDEEKLRFLTEVLRQKGVQRRAVVFDPNGEAPTSLTFRALTEEDVGGAVEQLRRQGRVSV